MQPYNIISFDRTTGTFTVQFADSAFNYNAPRVNGVYLAGQELEDAIQLLLKPLEDLTPAEYQLRYPEDDPQGVTGGEDIDLKVANGQPTNL